MKLFYLICGFTLLLCSNVMATHIIGGHITYRHLSGTTYELELVIYRDCISGVPPFDDPAYVGMFNSSGTLLSTLLLSPADSVQLMWPFNCWPSNLCIKRARYITSVNLGSAAITFAYQRCCRSGSIVNIVNPLDMGMTFSTTIKPLTPNNSPVFDHEYAAYSYVGDQFRFYASATDIDGDSLVYSLDNAFEGASQANPAPINPSPPPYNYIPWSPGYSMANMLNGSAPLTIDPLSGLITGEPGAIGMHVIAYKTEEYRNGILIGTHRREFVLNVYPATYADLFGSAYVLNGTQPIDVGHGWLIRHNSLDGTLFATDTAVIINGTYSHLNNINGFYLSKASADPASVYYSSHLPTYYGDVLFWHQSNLINLCVITPVNSTINLAQGVNPGGPGFVGGFVSDGANRIANGVSSTSASGVTIILFNSQQQPVAYDITDASGYFGIGNIPLGDYHLYIDRIGYLVDNNLAPLVTLSISQPVLDNQEFILHDIWLEHLGTVGLDNGMERFNKITLFPNPAGGQLFVESDFFSVEGTPYCIYDVTGRKIQEGQISGGVIVIENIPSQIYIINIGMNYFRFMKH